MIWGFIGEYGGRGDLVARGALASQTDCVIDIFKVTNQNTSSQSKASIASILSGGKKIKNHGSTTSKHANNDPT